MERELFVTIANEQYKVFLGNGFFNANSRLSSFFHQHDYCEVHIIVRGNAKLITDENITEISGGDLVLIPNKTMHCFKDMSKDIMTIPFQIQITDYSFKLIKIKKEFFEEMAKAIEIAKVNENYSNVQALLSYFCTALFEDKKLSIQHISNYEFIIREYFSLNYNRQIKLGDLAKKMHLSEKQTERLIIKYTGNTFKKELTKRRMDVAEHMAFDKTISLKEIAEYVGYQSYSGFWKTRKRIEE